MAATICKMVALSPNVSAEQGLGGEAAARKGGERTSKSIVVAGARAQFNHYNSAKKHILRGGVWV